MPELRLYNSLTRQDEPFAPADGHTVRLYTCGPTVYNPAHLGNFRTFLFEDLLRRVIRLRGWNVEQVMNLTDVDDKIIRRANEEGVAIDVISRRYEEVFLADLDALGVRRPDVMPRATENIPQMAALIATLLEKGHAYRTDDGSVFFRIASWPDYGRLARLERVEATEMRVGERVEADEYGKDDARDFALWKGSKSCPTKLRSPTTSGAPPFA